MIWLAFIHIFTPVDTHCFNGQFISSNGIPVQNAIIVLENNTTYLPGVKPNLDGTFSICHLPSGIYTYIILNEDKIEILRGQLQIPKAGLPKTLIIIPEVNNRLEEESQANGKIIDIGSDVFETIKNLFRKSKDKSQSTSPLLNSTTPNQGIIRTRRSISIK